jgi:Ca2+-binding RTX toxin-like protein
MALITGTDDDDDIDNLYTINGGPPTDGNDQINGLARNDQISGLGGNDDIDGGSGIDALVGGAGDDHLIGGTGDDNLFGGAGNDILEGGGGLDVLTGGDNNDQLDGGAGFDSLAGGAGDDTLIIKLATDLRSGESYAGGTGTDTLSIWDQVNISFAEVLDIERLTSAGSIWAQAAQISGKQFLNTGELTFTSPGVVDLAGKQVATRFFVLDLDGNTLDLTGDVLGFDVVGSFGVDTVLGGTGDDVLRGGAGNDLLKGNESKDELIGAAATIPCSAAQETTRRCSPTCSLTTRSLRRVTAGKCLRTSFFAGVLGPRP